MSNTFSFTPMGNSRFEKFKRLNRIIMCGLGTNHKVVNNKIKLINDLKKVSLVSGKKKRTLNFLNGELLIYLCDITIVFKEN